MDDYSKELNFAINAVAHASRLCQSVQAKVTPETLSKKDRSPVTIADFASQAIVALALQESFPDDLMIGEEDSQELRSSDQQEQFLTAIHHELRQVNVEISDDQLYDAIDYGANKKYQDRFWTLDPIDGTKGFLRNGQYAVSLALVVKGQLKVAAVACPNLPDSLDDQTEERTGIIFHAISGQGAFMTSLDQLQEKTEIRVTNTAQTNEMRFCESVESGHSSHGHSAKVAETLGIVKDPVRLDSQAKYCVVARAEADIYLRLPTRPGYREKIWDHAGGALVVQEAGGIVTDIDGKPLDFSLGHELISNRGVVVSNGKRHDEVIAAISQLGLEPVQ